MSQSVHLRRPTERSLDPIQIFFQKHEPHNNLNALSRATSPWFQIGKQYLVVCFPCKTKKFVHKKKVTPVRKFPNQNKNKKAQPKVVIKLKMYRGHVFLASFSRMLHIPFRPRNGLEKDERILLRRAHGYAWQHTPLSGKTRAGGGTRGWKEGKKDISEWKVFDKSFTQIAAGLLDMLCWQAHERERMLVCDTLSIFINSILLKI